MRREESKAVRVIIKINVEKKRENEKPKKRWLDTIKNDMRDVLVCVCRACRKSRQVKV
jgi:hypothetical protein